MADKEQVANTMAREYVRTVMKSTGLDATALARKARVSPSTITGMLSDSPRTLKTRKSTLMGIERVTGVELPPEIRGEIGESQSFAISATGGIPRNVPIYAMLAVPGQRFFHLNMTPTDKAPRPPGIIGMANAYAIRMPDDSMNGWRRRHELIYIDPGRNVGPDDHALVEFANTIRPNGPSFYLIRRLLQESDNSITLGTWGDKPTSVPFDKAAIVGMRYAVEWPELTFG